MTTVPGRKAGPFVCRFCPGIAGDCASDAVSLKIAPDVFHVLHIGVPEFADAPPLFGENDPVPGHLENQRCGKQDGGLRQKRVPTTHPAGTAAFRLQNGCAGCII